MGDGKLAAAVKAAAEAAMSTEGTAEAETPDETITATPGSQGAQTEVGTVENESDETEATAEASAEGTVEVPTDYYGLDLSVLPAETRLPFVKMVTEQNALITKLQQARTPAEEAATAQATAPEEAQPLTDEVLLQAMQLDLDDPFDANTAKVALPLARQLLELKSEVSGLSQTASADQTQRYWESTLDKLEADSGPLGFPRENLYQYAVDNNIADPESAYWRVIGPTRSNAIFEIQKQAKAAATVAKKAASGTRPTTRSPSGPAALEATNTKDAVKEAALRAAKELGYDWGEAFTGSFVQN